MKNKGDVKSQRERRRQRELENPYICKCGAKLQVQTKTAIIQHENTKKHQEKTP